MGAPYPLARVTLRIFNIVWMTLKTGPLVFTYDQILVLPEVAAKVHNQNFEKNKLKALDKNNRETIFFATGKEKMYFNCSI